MRVKTQHHLQPAETKAHSVVIEDDLGNPIIVAIQLPEAIVYSTAGDKNFHDMLKGLGITKTVKVSEFRPKPVDSLIWTP